MLSARPRAVWASMLTQYPDCYFDGTGSSVGTHDYPLKLWVHLTSLLVDSVCYPLLWNREGSVSTDRPFTCKAIPIKLRHNHRDNSGVEGQAPSTCQPAPPANRILGPNTVHVPASSTGGSGLYLLILLLGPAARAKLRPRASSSIDIASPLPPS